MNLEFFFSFYFWKKNGSVGRWETKHFIGMAQVILRKFRRHSVSRNLFGQFSAGQQYCLSEKIAQRSDLVSVVRCDEGTIVA